MPRSERASFSTQQPSPGPLHTEWLYLGAHSFLQEAAPLFVCLFIYFNLPSFLYFFPSPFLASSVISFPLFLEELRGLLFFKLTKNLPFLPRLSFSHFCVGFHARLAVGVKAACSGVYFFLQMGPPGGVQVKGAPWVRFPGAGRCSVISVSLRIREDS